MGRDIKGNAVSVQPLIAVDNGALSIEESRRVFEEKETHVGAMTDFRQAYKTGRLSALLQAVVLRGSGSLYPEAMKLLGSVPTIGTVPILHPEQLIAAGIWTQGPVGWDIMASSPRYFKGRQV